jgi:hypothetical protein
LLFATQEGATPSELKEIKEKYKKEKDEYKQGELYQSKEISSLRRKSEKKIESKDKLSKLLIDLLTKKGFENYKENLIRKNQLLALPEHFNNYLIHLFNNKEEFSKFLREARANIKTDEEKLNFDRNVRLIRSTMRYHFKKDNFENEKNRVKSHIEYLYKHHGINK